MKLFGGTIDDPHQLHLHQLGAALKMERTILDMLEELEEKARIPELADALREHRAQTERHVKNVELAFEALGEEPDDSSSPAIDGLKAEGKANLKLVEERLNDHVIVSAAGETEHHEIAVYEELITQAEVLDEQDVVALLRENLEDEQAMLKRTQALSRQLAHEAEITS